MFKIAEARTGTIHNLARQLESERPTDKGALYELTEGNVLSENGLLATPGDFWGRAMGAIGEHHGRDLLDAVYSIIASAQQSVDVMSLAPFPDGVFKTTIQRALAALAASGRTVTVRFVFGQPYLLANLATKEFLQEITSGITSKNLSVYVAQFTPKNSIHVSSWNHAKIVAADGAVAMVGGHNFYSDTYLSRTSPIFDLSIKVQGPAAASAQKFANRIWEYIKANNRHGDPSWKTYSNSFVNGAYGELASDSLTLTPPAGKGDVPILGVAHPGKGLSTDDKEINASERAMIYFIENATQSVYISQQDLIKGGALGDATWNPEIFAALEKFILDRKGKAGIVVSTPHAKAGSGSYSDNFDPNVILQALVQAASKAGKKIDHRLYETLQQRVFVGTIRFNHADKTWSGANPMGNHAKFWMVDERVFYVGSHNMYPTAWFFSAVNKATLQEYGYVIDHAPTAQRVLQTYWRPLVEYSLNSAISGLNWGIGPESFTLHKTAVDLPKPATRIGPLSTDADNVTRLFTLTGSGELMIRRPDEKGRWEVTHVDAPEGARVTALGPGCPPQRSVFATTPDGTLKERRMNVTGGESSWRDHGKPGNSAVIAMSPLWEHTGYSIPYRFFVIAQDGNLWSRYWEPGERRWEWQLQPLPGGAGRLTAFGPLLYNASDAVPMRLFVLDANGKVYEKSWSPSTNYQWADRGQPPSRGAVTAIGGMITDPTVEHPIKVYTIAGGALCELYLEKATGKWLWNDHGAPDGTNITALGPTFLNNDYGDALAKVFVVASDGALWERFWAQSRRRWEWRPHGLAGGAFRIAGIGPRPAPNAGITGAPRIFVTTEQGRLFERRWIARDREWIWTTTQWERDDLPAAPHRIGEAVEKGFDDQPLLYTASGRGHLTVRGQRNGAWPALYELAPDNDFVAALGPVIDGARRLAVVKTTNGLAHAEWNATSKSWTFASQPLPDGARIEAFGPLHHDPSYQHPYRYFVAGENGNLYDRYTDANFSAWSWQAHGQPAGGRVRSISGVLFDKNAEYPIRLFVSAADGKVYERRYKTQWSWDAIASPSFYIEAAGPLLREGNDVLRLFALASNGELWERNSLRGSAWTWVNHETPGAPVAAIGPAFLQSGRVRLFVRTLNGELWERRSEGGPAAFTWIRHELPDANLRVAAIGPRTLHHASMTVATPRVFVTTTNGALHEVKM